ncbi:MAG: hypothetical protein K0U59_00415 [Gammaproteobacteria bacterium]|nr:hypothetical protein [Gammaproteobacteria bacterium]
MVAPRWYVVRAASRRISRPDGALEAYRAPALSRQTTKSSAQGFPAEPTVSERWRDAPAPALHSHVFGRACKPFYISARCIAKALVATRLWQRRPPGGAVSADIVAGRDAIDHQQRTRGAGCTTTTPNSGGCTIARQ